MFFFLVTNFGTGGNKKKKPTANCIRAFLGREKLHKSPYFEEKKSHMSPYFRQ